MNASINKPNGAAAISARTRPLLRCVARVREHGRSEITAIAAPRSVRENHESAGAAANAAAEAICSASAA